MIKGFQRLTIKSYALSDWQTHTHQDKETIWWKLILLDAKPMDTELSCMYCVTVISDLGQCIGLDKQTFWE